ncbi:GAF domain-containing protein [Amnibacterium kyonggiense]|uniref:GAF domain-containing protein n=1 Tax=Amnibacterium kyonggiense TaxID=595671 RepID=A0A4V3EAJ6_9MICO|nr:GAF domain-containing protein [Amnibacterium kyonggiense]TDS76844.1 GAF domain-containing protein [Amnibacterium kyonggiense]
MSDPGLPLDEPRVDFDRRLSDLVHAANDVLATQRRLRALLRANQAITAQLDLDSVLRSVVEAARQLTGARYGAIGVIGEHGGLDRFVHAGMDEAHVERIGRLPRGEGLLGAVITEARPIRIPDIGADPRSVGFPDGHPPMHDFLGVPVRVRGIVYGNLYLSGHPDGAFTDEDEQLVRSLAASAGFAVENARLYRDVQRREAWAAASAQITARLLAPEEGDALPLIAERTRQLAQAMSTFVLLVADDPEQVHVVSVGGADPNGVAGAIRPLSDTLATEVLRTGAPRRFEEQDLRDLGDARFDAFGPVMALPLLTDDRTIGTVVVARAPGEPAFTDADLAAAADFVGRAAVALELVRVREQADRVLLFEDRARIARDLHDRVIQQLFATGMQLQAVLGTLDAGPNADRVDAAITSLDESISQIRRVIFTLQSPGRTTKHVTGRQRLIDLIERRSAALSVEPSVTVTGPVDSVLDGDLADDVLAVVGEGMSNAVKHAAAEDIAIDVAADARGVTVTVTVANGGRAPTDGGRRSGLRNLEERAARRNGSMRLEPEDGRTVLTWSVPVNGDDDA